MCGRFASFLSPELLAATFDIQTPTCVEPHRNMHDPGQIEQLCSPDPGARLQACMVAEMINNPRFDSPDCVARI
jgi:putative SOS response-associated peptidase YedK